MPAMLLRPAPGPTASTCRPAEALAGAQLVGAHAVGRNVAAGGSYTQSLDFTLPQTVDGDYQVIVVADALDQLFESPYEGNNDRAGATTLKVVHPDLRADVLRVPASAESASTVQVEWDVTNAGTAPVSGSWTDRVYLSRDGTVGTGDLLVVSRAIDSRTLAPGATYTETASFALPVDATGDYRLIVVSDAGDAIAELNAESNNQGTAAAGGGVGALRRPAR